MQIGHWTEVLGDAELANGLGLSAAQGIAGFPNLDAVRDPALTAAPYLARLMIHQVFALSHLHDEAARGPLSTFAELPDRRIEVRLGKLAVTDSFDTNAVGGDSHIQFLNWAIRRFNTDVDLPESAITVVHRSDGSGTTWVWSDLLSNVSSSWSSSVGRGTTLQWPVGVGAEGNEGVAEAVRNTPNSIGYVELTYAIQHRLS